MQVTHGVQSDVFDGSGVHVLALARLFHSVRLGLRIAGTGLRDQLPAIFLQALLGISHQTVENYVAGLGDAAAVEVLERYMQVRHGRGEGRAVEYLRRQLR